MPYTNVCSPISGVILAGGRGRRLGGRDKGLVTIEGRPLIEHVIAALAPHVSAIIINANRNVRVYERYGYPVVTDVLPNYQGPLAGILSGLRYVEGDIVVVPCDALSLPPDLVVRLRQALLQANAEVSVAHDGARLQPLYAMLKHELTESLESYLRQGRHKVEDWQREQRLAIAHFSDVLRSFRNLNTVEDLEALETSDIELCPGPGRR
jgi:molybdopterin-guanine dinucleotide biosynthesis protein A